MDVSCHPVLEMVMILRFVRNFLLQQNTTPIPNLIILSDFLDIMYMKNR